MRFLKPALLIAALAVVAAACGGSTGEPLATIDGQPISMEDVTALRASYVAGEVNTSTEQFRTDLSNVLFREAIVAAAAGELGITVTEADIDERIANPPERYATLFAQAAADDDLTEAALRHQALLSILRDRVATELVRQDDGLEEALADSPETLTAACVRHILVTTADEAEAVIDRLEAGEDFAAVADELSLDTASAGGALVDADGTCMIPLARYVPEFAAAAATAPIGEIVGPVETQFGFHVMVVDDREDPPTIEEIKADPLGRLDNRTVSDYFTPWFNEVVRAAMIQIDPLVGSWSEAGIGIVPPGA